MSVRNDIRIPESQYDNFKFLLNLPLEIKDKFISTIKDAPIGISETALYNLLREKLNNHLSPKKVGEIFSIYINLSNAKEELELSDDTFLENLLSAFGETEDEDLKKVSISSLGVFKELFSSQNIFNISRKIEGEYLQNEKNFSNVKVITDVRTVFDNNDFVASTIVNKLKFSFYENEVEKDFFLSVDEHDLEKIIIEIKNAQMNNNYIKEKFESLKIINILK